RGYTGSPKDCHPPPPFPQQRPAIRSHQHASFGASLMPPRLALLAFLVLPAFADGAAPPPVSPTAHGDRLRDAYFRLQAEQLGAAALADIRSKADWDKARPELHRRFLDMMGLWPLPPR